MPNIFGKADADRGGGRRRSRTECLLARAKVHQCHVSSRRPSTTYNNLLPFNERRLQLAISLSLHFFLLYASLSLPSSLSLFVLPGWWWGTHKLICVGIGFVWICVACGCFSMSLPLFPPLPPCSPPRRDFVLPAERSATSCRSVRALFTQINWTAANLLHKTLPNAVASAAFVKDTYTVTMH